ncbi:MAG TPA: phage holin family protein [Chthoniobacterales bacterium]
MAAIPVSEAETTRVSAGNPFQEWLAAALKFLELKLHLLGFESREAGIHLAILAALIASSIVLLVGALVFLAVFLLFILIKITGWEWGWAALLTAVLLLVMSAAAAFFLRSRITKPLYTLTFAELRKDREWLRQSRESNKL